MPKTTKAQRDEQRAAWLKGVQADLQGLLADERKALIEELIGDFFVDARATLLKWSAVTGQSAQIDTGYIAQHLASLVLRVPGQGFKGKGLDLGDGSEVKAASILSSIDHVRWNHELRTADADRKREAEGVKTKGFVYLHETPFVFYMLLDCVYDGLGPTSQLRVRGWCINARTDDAWRALIIRFLDARQGKTCNLQLHPPIGYDDSLVTNELGNLEMSDALVLDVRFEMPSPGEPIEANWQVARLDVPRDFESRCAGLPYVAGVRPNRMEDGLAAKSPQLTIQDMAPASEAGGLMVAAGGSESETPPEDSEDEE